MQVVNIFAFLLLLLGLACAVDAQQAAADDIVAFKHLHSECIQQSKLGAAEAKIIVDLEMNNTAATAGAAGVTPERKCFYACMYKKTNGFDATGKPNLDILVKYAAARYPGKQAAVNQQLLNSCLPQSTASECDKIYDFHLCISKALNV